VRFTNGDSSYAIERGDKPIDSETWTPVGLARELRVAANPYYSRGVSIYQNYPNGRAIFAPRGTSSMGTTKMSINSCDDGKAACQASPKRRCERCVTTLLTGRVAIAQ
jgi:hypothetical protein